MLFNLENISKINQTLRDTQRGYQVFQVLMKYFPGYFVDKLNLEQYIELGYKVITRKKWEKLEDLTFAQRVRRSLEELGPTFVKLGQILSTRPDLIPLDLIQELEKLQDNVPSFPFEQAKEIIEGELGKTLNELFADIDETPFAAASIGQVHRATLLESGESVVIKVQRPGIEKIIQVDLEIMMFIAGLLERNFSVLSLQKPTAIVKEFARALEKEIDYKTEAYNMDRFRHIFEEDPAIYVPTIHLELTAERVLTMEFVEGIKASNVDELREKGYDLDLIAHRGAISLMQQVFVHGFFHGDPHPGNILIQPDNIICFLDFGMMGRVSLTERQHFADFMMQILQKDERKVVDAVMRLTYHEIDPPRDEFERDVAEIIDENLYRPLQDLDTGKLLEEIMNILTKYGLRLKPNLFLMVKALISVDRIGNMLNPELELVREAEPFIRQIQLERLNPIRFIKNMVSPMLDFFELMGEMPQDFHVLVKQLKGGKFKMEFEHRGLETLRETLERISYRLSFTILLAALIMGYALITLARTPDRWTYVHYVGMTGFMAAGLVGFWVLWTFIRGKKF